MTSTIFVKRGDDSRVIQDTLTYSDGSVVDLTDAAVTLVWNGEEKPATIVSETGGQVSYSLTTEDVAEAGTVQLEWRVQFSDSTFLTVPTTNRIVLRILEDLLTPNP